MSTKTLGELRKDIAAARAKNPDWLSKSGGKYLLKKAVELRLGWKDMERIFGQSQRTLERRLSRHGISKPRITPVHYIHSNEVIAIVRRYYAASAEMVKSVQGSGVWRDRMMAEVNERRRLEKLGPVTVNAVHHLACGLGLKWGWSAWNKKLPPLQPKEIQAETAARAAEDKEWLKSLDTRLR